MKTNKDEIKLSKPAPTFFTADDEAPVLVVVDMQIGYKAARDPETLENVLVEIRRAMEKKEAIVILEYVGDGDTLRAIRDLVDGYPLCVTMKKTTWGGAEEVFEACMDNGFWPENYRICGVNADACVLQTVTGLLDKVKTCRIELVQNACHTDSKYHNWPNLYKKLERVVLV